jgi:hypothetical protein
MEMFSPRIVPRSSAGTSENVAMRPAGRARE